VTNTVVVVFVTAFMLLNAVPVLSLDQVSNAALGLYSSLIPLWVTGKFFCGI